MDFSRAYPFLFRCVTALWRGSCLLWLAGNVAASPTYSTYQPIVVDDAGVNGVDSIYLKPYTYFKPTAEPIDDPLSLLSANPNDWLLIGPEDSLLFKGQVWVRMDFQLNQSHQQDWLLQFPASRIDEVEVYLFHNNQLLQHSLTGNRFGFHSRLINHRSHVIPLQLPLSGAATVLVRLEVPLSITEAPYLHTMHAFQNLEQKLLFVIAAGIGAIIIMFIYNGFIFLTIRDRSYLYYTLTICVSLVFHLSWLGFDFQYLWPEQRWLHTYILSYTSSMILVFASLFCMHFLNTGKTMPVMHRLLKLIMYLQVPLALMALAHWYTVLSLISPLVGIFAYFVFVALGIHAVMKKFVSGYSFLVGWLCVCFMSSFLSWSLISGFYNHHLIIYALLSTVVEQAFFSFALAGRIKILQDNEITEKNEFLARVSHELKTPMNGIMGNLYLLGSDTTKQLDKETLNNLTSSAKKLNQLVHDILSFSNDVEQNDFSQWKEENFIEFIQKITEQFRSQCAAKNLLLSCSVSPEIATFQAFDKQRLTIVLTKIIENCIQNTDGGYIILLVTDGRHRGVHEKLHFSIMDSGAGIEHDRLAEILQPFKQLSHFYSRNYGGLGLGLSLVHKQLTLMGAKLRVSSNVGEGARFYFSIKTRECLDNPEPKDISNKWKETDLSGISILYVEDNKINQSIVKKLLTRANAKVDLVDNGELGVCAARDHRYDLILMDCSMPVMNGFDATACLRRAKIQTPIIALTANTMPGDKERCLAAGMDDYLPKPIDPQQLFSRILSAVPPPLVGGTADLAYRRA